MNIKQLHSLFLKSNSVCTDTRKIESNDLYFALKGENFNGNTFAKKALENGARFAIIDEPKFKIENNYYILVDDVLTTLQQLANYHRNYLGIKIIALTGSNGKTTTKELINVVLSQKYNTVATIGNLNNHIGVPLTLLSMTKTTEIGIIEMGANHLKEIEFLCNIAEPNFGYITNFGKAHLEGFGSIEGVIKGKSELYNHLKNTNGLIFFNTEDKTQIKQVGDYKSIFKFGKTKHDDAIIKLKDVNPFVFAEFKGQNINSHLIGNYNFNNISAAITIGHYFNVDLEAIKYAIESYCPENNRSQIIEKNSVKIILDAYNANPTSMKAALQNLSNLEGPKIAILGDMFELGPEAEQEHQNIANLALKLNIDQVILVGENFSNVKQRSSKLKVFTTFNDAKQKISDSDFSNSSLLIKGSRGMALERVLDLL